MSKTVYALLLSLYGGALFAQTTQKAAVQSSGGLVSQVGNIRHECVVGQAAAGTGVLSPTGPSGNVGFLTIDQAANTAPVAHAGDDKVQPEGGNVSLDGAKSFDPQGSSLTYQWVSLDGITLSSANGPAPSFVAPDVIARRKFRFVLTVSDGALSSAADTVTIVVADPGWIPVPYSNSTSTYALVTINGQIAEECDVVGAYVNGECRAATEVILFQGQAYAVFNIQTELPEAANFRVYDYSKDKICDAPGTVTTIPGGDLGAFDNPIPIHASCASTVAAFSVSSQTACVGKPVTVTFTGAAGPSAQYGWDFSGATVLSGTGPGPYIIRWSSSGAKTVRLQIIENNIVSNLATLTVMVYPTSTQTVTQQVCQAQDTVTQVLTLGSIYGCDSIVIVKRIYLPTVFTLVGVDDYCGDAHVGVSIVSGPGNYSYTWSTGDKTATVSGIANGTYTVTVTDGAGCTYTGTVQVGGTLPLTATATLLKASGCTGATGSAFVQAGGGIPPYLYQWDNGETTAIAAALAVGTHRVTIEDAEICLTETQVLVPPLGFPFVSGVSTQHFFCGIPGSIGVTINGGAPPFTYNWSNGQSTAAISGLFPGFYSLTATDQNGCVATISNIEIKNEGDAIALGFSQQNCAIKATALNGSGPYTYQWNTGATGATIGPVYRDTLYIVSITDANGCFGTDTILANTGVIDAGFSFTVNDFDVAFKGANMAAANFWNFGDGNTSNSLNPVHTYGKNGTYTVLHITISPCGNDTASATVNITAVGASEPGQASTVRLSPNPSAGVFTVQAVFQHPVTGRYYLYNVLGSLMETNTIQGATINFDLDLTACCDGIYWLSLRTKEGVSTHKLIKQAN